MIEFKDASHAINTLFEELFNSEKDIYVDAIYDALFFLAEQIKDNDLLEEMQDFSGEDINVIHREAAKEIINGRFSKCEYDIVEKIDWHVNRRY